MRIAKINTSTRSYASWLNADRAADRMMDAYPDLRYIIAVDKLDEGVERYYPVFLLRPEQLHLAASLAAHGFHVVN
jgi:hypothetical protein